PLATRECRFGSPSLLSAWSKTAAISPWVSHCARPDEAERVYAACSSISFSAAYRAGSQPRRPQCLIAGILRFGRGGLRRPGVLGACGLAYRRSESCVEDLHRRAGRDRVFAEGGGGDLDRQPVGARDFGAHGPA